MSDRPRVRLMLTCLCDAFYGEVGIATVRVLEHVGCEVIFDESQTCCGQPAFNSGDWEAARKVALHASSVLLGAEPVVTPSTSCAAMLREGYPMLFEKATSTPVLELAEFLVKELKVDSWPPGGPSRAVRSRKIAFHRACHSRAIHLHDMQERLLESIPGVELVPFAQEEQCCGFGGAFSALYPSVSAGIGEEKLENVLASGVEQLVSGDMGCLMHLNGLIERNKLPLKTRHFVEVLAEAIP